MKAFRIVTLIFIAIIFSALNVKAGNYSGGNGSIADPYQISTIADIIELSNSLGDWDKHFIQTADITFDQDYNNVDWDGDGSTVGYGAAGFIPIGTDADSRRFTGSYRGVDNGTSRNSQLRTITNLYINRSYSDNIGLFGTTKGATISYIGLKNVSIKGGQNTGGFVGKAIANEDTNTPTTISYCYVEGEITGGEESDQEVAVLLDGDNTGGFVGAIINSTITNSYSKVTILGKGEQVGGFVGYAQGATISSCFTESTVSGYNVYVGGFAGQISGTTITNSYSNGSASNIIDNQGDKTTIMDKIGGFIGHVNTNSTITGSYSTTSVNCGDDYYGGFIGVSTGDGIVIDNCYATGTVGGDYYGGGFIGLENSGTTISNSYASGLVFTYRYDGGEIRTFVGRRLGTISNCYGDYSTQCNNSTNVNSTNNFSEFTDGSSITNFDNTIWVNNNDGLRPYLLWESSGTTAAISNGNIINNILTLNTTAPNGTSVSLRYREKGELEWANITTTVTVNGGTASVDLVNDITGNLENNTKYIIQPYITILGNNLYGDAILTHLNKYSGGDGTESNPFIIASATDLISLSQSPEDWASDYYFSQTADIDFTTNHESIDWDNDGELEHELNGDDYYGFRPIGSSINYFIGNYEGNGHTISNLYIYNNKHHYNGLFGRALNSKISNLKLVDEVISVSGNYNYTGGLIGHISGLEIDGNSRIENCTVSADIKTSYNYTGGLVGNAHSTAIVNCYTEGVVSGGETGGYVGGLAGRVERRNAKVENCSSSASVSGDRIIGGLIASSSAYSTNYKNSYSTGVVSGNSEVGGFWGWTSNGTPIISNCYSTGAVIGQNSVGGFIGNFSNQGSSITFTSCYATGEIILISGSEKTGGFIGNDSEYIITYDGCYFDSETTNTTIKAGYSHSENTSQIVNLTTSDFASSTNFTNYNNSIWSFDSSGRPYLSWQTNNVSNSASTYSDGEITINGSSTGTVNGYGIRYATIENAVAGNWSYKTLTSLATSANVGLLDSDNLVQPYIINTSGDKIYGDMTLLKIPHTLHFEDGVEGETITVPFDETLNRDESRILTEEPSRAGYDFAGWLSDSEEIYKKDETIVMPEYDVSLTALWSKDGGYKVIYDLGYENAPAAPLDLDYYTPDSRVDIDVPEPERSGYEFDGWVTSDIDGTEDVFMTDDYLTMPDNYVFLKASWNKYYTITYDGNGYTSGTLPVGKESVNGINYAVYDSSISLKRKNYTFNGWYATYINSSGDRAYPYGSGPTGMNSNNDFTMPKGDVTIEAQWLPKSTHQLTINDGNGSVTTSPEASGNVVGLTVPIRSGYNFAGWSDGNTIYKGNTTFTMPDKDVTLTAQWSDSGKWMVLYSGEGTENLSGGEYSNGDGIAAASTPVHPLGYHFEGWKTSDISGSQQLLQAEENFTMGTNHIVLKAVWSSRASVTYNAGEFGLFDGGISLSITNGLEFGDDVPTAPALNTTSGYEFIEWIRVSGQESRGASGNNPAQVGKSDLVYKAQYRLSPSSAVYIGELAFTEAGRDTLLAAEAFIMNGTVAMSSDDVVHNNATIRFRFPKKYINAPYIKSDGAIDGFATLQGTDVDPELYFEGDEAIVEYRLESLSGASDYIIPAIFKFNANTRRVSSGVISGNYGTLNGYTATVRLEIADENENILQASSLDITNKNYDLELRKYITGGGESYQAGDNRVKNLGVQDPLNEGFLAPDNSNRLTFRYNLYWAPYKINYNIGRVSYKDVVITEHLPDVAKFDSSLNPNWKHLGDGTPNGDGTYMGGTVTFSVIDDYAYHREMHYNSPYSIVDADLHLTYPGAKMHDDPDNDNNYSEHIDESNPLTLPYLNSTTVTGREFDESEIRDLTEDDISYFIKEHQQPGAGFYKFGGRNMSRSDDGWVSYDSFYQKNNANWGYVLRTSTSTSIDWEMENIIMEDYGMDVTHLKFHSLGVFYDGEGELKGSGTDPGTVTLEYTEDGINWETLTNSATALPLVATGRNEETVPTNYILPEGVDALKVRLKSNSGSYLEAASSLYLVIDADIREEFLTGTLFTEEAKQYTDSNNRLTQRWYYNSGIKYIYSYNYAAYHSEWKDKIGDQRKTYTPRTGPDYEYQIENGNDTYDAYVQRRNIQVRPYYISPSVYTQTNTSNEIFQEITSPHTQFEMRAVDQLDNMVMYIQLPKGMIFTGNDIRVAPWANQYQSSDVDVRDLTDDSWYQIVDDWRGEGRQTLVANLGSYKSYALDHYSRNHLFYDVMALPEIRPDANYKCTSDIYITTDDHYALSWGSSSGTTPFNAGGYGDNKEENEYYHRTADYTILLPQEVYGLLYGRGKYDDSYKHKPLESKTDIAGSIEYKITITNGKVSQPVKEVEIINVLPYLNDMSILPGEGGGFDPRKSTTSVTLEGPVEPLSGYDYFYSIEQGKENFNAFSSAIWYTKDQIEGSSTLNWEDIKSIKIIGDATTEIPAGESVNFIYPTTGEIDYTIDHSDEVNNSFAFTHKDAGGRWSESTMATTRFTDYEISGYAFIDTDGDNRRDNVTSEYLSGHTVDVERRNSNNIWEAALDAYGNSYKTATESNGYYKIDVHEPGEYRMVFDSKKDHDITDYFLVDADNNPIQSNLSYNNGPFYSSDNVILSPANEQIYINGGYKATVTYRLFYEDGVDEEITVPINPHHYAEGRVIILDDMIPERTNYIFTGWVDENDNNRSYPTSGTLVMPGADVTLTAQWRTADQYRVLYDGNENDGGVVPTDNTNYETDAQAYVKPELPTRSNHTFEGWLYKGVIYSSTDQLPLPDTGLDILLVAQWRPQYRVFYVDGVSNDEIVVPTDNSLYYEDANVGVSPTEPNRSNYNFGGWSYKNNLYSASGNFIMPGEDVTLTATWIPVEKYRLFYDGNGADITTVPVNSSSYFEGDMIVVAGQEPSRPGYRFDGWLYDGDIYQPWLPVYIPVPGEDITLVAQWTPMYNVIYDINGGDQETEPTDNQDYLAGTIAPVSAQTPTRRDALSNPTHRFGGWLDEETGTLYPVGGSVLMPTADVTLVAQWNLINKYAVLYDGNGSDGGVIPVDNVDYDAGVIALVEDDVPTRYGFEFLGWLSDEDIPTLYQGGTSNSDNFTMPPRNITLTAQWRPLYTITYLGGGSGATNIPVDNAGPYAEGTVASVSLDVPLRVSVSGTPYDFLYWRDEDGNQYASGANLTMPDHDVVLTAFWLIQGDNRYKVIYDGNGANIGTTPIDPFLYYPGADVDILEEIPVRDGYQFIGWNDDNTTVTHYSGGESNGESFTMPSRNVVLTAQWAVHSYTVTYDDGVDDSSVSDMPTPLINPNLIYDYEFELAQDGSSNNIIPTRPNYYFAGWQIDVSTKDLDAGDIIHTEINQGVVSSFNIPNRDVILTAQWKRVFTVTYDQNAPDGEVSNMPTSLTSDVAEGYLYVLDQDNSSENTIPTRAGYFFGGWQIDVATSNYLAGEIIHTETNKQLPATFYMPGSNVILTAQWGGSISGIAFIDNNQDGKYSSDDDTTLSAVTASLQKLNGTAWESTGAEVTTTTNGYYAFNELSDGSYRILFERANDQYFLIDYTAWVGNLTEPTSNVQNVSSDIISDQFDISETTSSYEMGIGYRDGCLVYKTESESGVIGGIYLIQSAADLICLSNHTFYWDKNCYQTEDCNFLDSSQLGSLWSDKNNDLKVQDDEIDFNMDGDFSNDADGFNPIGVGFETTTFTGYYTGSNDQDSYSEIKRSISNLYIDTPDHNTVASDINIDGSYAALFGSVQGSTIKSILLIDPDVTGVNYVGAMIGRGNEVVETDNCHTVEGVVVGTGSNVGGFTGYYLGTVQNCSSSTDVRGTNSVGGFIGTNADTQVGGGLTDQIISCYATGFVYSTATGGEINIGGFVGVNANGIVDCYATGAVQVSASNETNIGGFCGSNEFVKTIKTSYASGDISQAGGNEGSRNAFVGSIDGSSQLSNNYFDANTTAATDIATGVSSKSTTDFSSLNIGSNWTQDNNRYGRPYLSWQSDNVSNPIPDNIYMGLSQSIGGISSVVDGSIVSGFRYRAVDLSYDWQNIDNQTTTPIELTGLVGGKLYYVQPFIYRADGLKEFGDMVVVEITAVRTLFIDGIDADARFHGSVDAGLTIKEYGFIYSYTKNDNSTLSHGESDVQSISVESNLTPLKSATDIGEYLESEIPINLRENCYIRAYIKMENGNYNYGEVVRFISEQRDFSLLLDGSSCLIADETSTSNSINSWGSGGEFSLDLWIKGANVATVQTLLSNIDGSDGYQLDITAEGKLEFIAGAVTVESTISILDTEWHHIGLSYDGSDLNIYVDREFDTSGSIAITNPTSNLIIGSGSSLSTPFTGNIDALRFWSCSLSQVQVEAIAYDNLTTSDNDLVKTIGSGTEIPGLDWSSLTASFGFNVRSTNESPNSAVPANYSDRNDREEYLFFHEDSRLSLEYSDYATYVASGSSFNLISVGEAKPSVELPRVNWRANSGTDDWLTSNNWSSYAYPGEGVGTGDLSLYSDVTSDVISDHYNNCLFTIINSSSSNPTKLTGTTTVDILVDLESSVGSYRIRNGGVLTILNKLVSKMWNSNITNEEPANIVVKDGSVEVH